MQTYCRYIPTQQAEQQWGMAVITAGYSSIKPHQGYPLYQTHPSDHYFTWQRGRRLDGFYLVFISRGEGVFETEGICRSVNAGTVFLLTPGQWHRYKPSEKTGWDEYWVGFRGPFPSHFMQSVAEASSPVIQVGQQLHLLTLFQELIEAVRVTTQENHGILAGITLQLVAQIQSAKFDAPHPIAAGKQLIKRIQFRIQEQLESVLSVEQLADEFGVSYPWLRQLFKQHVGQSILQYHLGLKIDKAKELLHLKHLTIAEVAYHSGFESTAYFTRLFKQKTGKTPTDYRVEST